MPINKGSLDPTSLERIVPDEVRPGEATGQESLDLHVARYEFAKANLTPGRLLDMACGSGHGTAMLSQHPLITEAVGVDLSDAAIQYATTRYGGERVSFLCADALNFRGTHLFDNIVSLETIEHVDDSRALFAHLVSLLTPGGRLIASVPVTPSVDANPHHKSNFSTKSFLRMGDEHSLEHLNSFDQVQRFSPIAIGLGRELRAEQLRKNLLAFYFQHPSHLILRIWSTLRYGFANRYLTVVWKKC